ncbi:MAG TPA: DUF5996 family protein [Acidimicrobiales bacterium]|jgi:hypothetical protein|nr:DUF5996 family protein [Acidimicrobiales bacterium]
MSGELQRWPAFSYESWRPTCDTLHAHTQLLGKLAVALAPEEPQLQHAALRLTPRGWETNPLPSPDGSGLLVVALDLRRQVALVEHTSRDSHAVPLSPHRSVRDVTRDVLGAIEALAGPVVINPRPQEVPWDVPLDQDDDHHTYEVDAIARYFSAATQAAVVLAELRAPYRGRSTPVNAWWGTFDLAFSLFSGRPADPHSDGFIARNAATAEQVEVGWWPGDDRHPEPAFFGFALPSRGSFRPPPEAPAAGRWDDGLGEYILEWEEVISSPDPRRLAAEFGRSVIGTMCAALDWDPALAASATGAVPPVH